MYLREKDKEYFMRHGHKILKDCRIRRGITQQDVADFCALSEASISHYEKGRHAPKRQTLKRMLHFFGMTESEYKEMGQRPAKQSATKLVSLERIERIERIETFLEAQGLKPLSGKEVLALLQAGVE